MKSSLVLYRWSKMVMMALVFVLPIAGLAANSNNSNTTPTSYGADVLKFDPSNAATTNTALNGSSFNPFLNVLELGDADPFYVAIWIINASLTLLGLLFLIWLVYAGTLWVMARGNDEQITKAKTIIKQSVIGLIIVLSSYGISNLLFTIFVNQTNPTT